MGVMQAEPTIPKRRQQMQRPVDLRELAAELKLEVARLEADIAARRYAGSRSSSRGSGRGGVAECSGVCCEERRGCR